MNLLHLITQASTYLAASFDGICAWLTAPPSFPPPTFEEHGFDFDSEPTGVLSLAETEERLARYLSLPSHETAVEPSSLHAELEAYDSLAWKLHVHPSAFTPEDSRAMRDLAILLNIRPTDERI